MRLPHDSYKGACEQSGIFLGSKRAPGTRFTRQCESALKGQMFPKLRRSLT